MNNKVFNYLEDKESNIFFEKLLYNLQYHYEINFENEDCYQSEGYDCGEESVSRVYPFSNEHLDNVFKDIDLDGGRALVVGSSGDQALHSVLAGAKEVTIMDGNMWTKPFVELKLAAIKNLNYNEFRQYFSSDLRNLFSHRYYSKISHDLSEQSRTFWDSIMLECPDDTLYNVHCKFIQDDNRGRINRYHSYYSSKEKYNELKKKLGESKIDFQVADISEFPKLAKGKYNLIMLSNIRDYGPDNYLDIVDNLYNNNLADNGNMQVYYTFTGFGKFVFYKGIEDYLREKYHNQLSCDEFGIYNEGSILDCNTNYTLHKGRFDEGMGN